MSMLAKPMLATPTLWTRMKAELGDSDAQYRLAEAVRTADVAASVSWYRRAARQGHVAAQTMLAFLLANGIGVPPDPRRAVSWYRRAAAKGDVGAQNNLGYMHEHGAGVPCDPAKAALWYRLAALQHSAPAQVNLALLLLDGRGVDRDEIEAVRWLRAAAEQGHPAAQYRLGLCLREGVGAARDPAEAALWLQAAAAAGDRDALVALAELRQTVLPDLRPDLSLDWPDAGEDEDDAAPWRPEQRRMQEIPKQSAHAGAMPPG
ncbi:tetratricopeptide repeat protein [Azospirillum palustre]|uniref:tetratricopeptide repeat protein n=1 Tax=Azospirillum palustre TaxID=2044885 RepID=UPI001FCEA232|nr:tetratricopeptide repeat protein [Azospirillum palustre]